ncbi:hypothetical protein POM88_013048 [Heracleum sosnowskyi]|uniref:Uncharacterized protein n=1 Tax=Heracleum sosnowskyi TaxID=360622 RepID=A0AAD8N313_9APIA|nr:hypothetical protein POM88_013048 [Heracleum sosnowskyi]
MSSKLTSGDSNFFPNLVVAGGGAVEAAMSVYLKYLATTLGSREQLAIAELAESLLIIPKVLSVNAVPDTIAKLPSLKELYIWDCKDVESLPTFDESHSIRCLAIRGCPILEERCEKESGPEWYKIQHISSVKISDLV